MSQHRDRCKTIYETGLEMKGFLAITVNEDVSQVSDETMEMNTLGNLTVYGTMNR